MVKLAEALKAFMKIVITYQRDKLFKLNFAVTYKCDSRCRMCDMRNVILKTLTPRDWVEIVLIVWRYADRGW